MSNLSKVLGGLLIGALIYIIFLTGCGGGSSNEVIKTVYVETTKTDTIEVRIPVKEIELKYIKVKIPVPYLDTTASTPDKPTIEDFDDFIRERPMVYQDTISDDSVLIHYRIRTWGFIDKMDIGYSVRSRYYIKEKTIVEKIVTKKKRFQGFYLGLDVNISDSALTHPTPIIELSTRRINYNIGYDFKDKTIRAGIRLRIGLKK